MTATITSPPAPTAREMTTGATGEVTLARTALSEWVKFRTLRSSWAMLLAAVAGFLLLGLVIAYNTGRTRVGLAPEDLALSATLQGFLLAQLILGVLGVLFVTGEYSTGMIRSTLAAVPKRVPVLFAKAGVLGALLLVVMTVTSFVGFLAFQAVLTHYHHGYSLSDPTAWRVVLGTGVYLTLIGLLGSALGWLVRSTPGGISAFVGLVLLVPVVFGELLGSWGRTVAKFLPGSAGESFIASVHADGSLQPWTGLAVMAAWVVGGLAIAALLLRRRDA